jgi:hypothetical protein
MRRYARDLLSVVDMWLRRQSTVPPIRRVLASEWTSNLPRQCGSDLLLIIEMSITEQPLIHLDRQVGVLDATKYQN